MQSEFDSLGNANAYPAMSLETFFDDMISATLESDGMEPLGFLGGWLENTDPLSQPYPHSVWNDLLSLQQSLEHSTTDSKSTSQDRHT
jgi:hypothetical protein